MKLIEAYKSGNKLDNSVAWKQVQLVMSIISVGLSFLTSFGVNLNLITDEISAYAWAIVWVVNGYLIVATTDKLGI